MSLRNWLHGKQQEDRMESIRLGATYQDRITGFQGVATGYVTELARAMGWVK